MNQKEIRDETSAKNECSRDDYFDTRIKHREHADCMQEYRRSQKIQKIDDLQNNFRREQKNIEIQWFLSQRRRFDNDFTTREIWDDDTRDKNQKHVLRHQKRWDKNDKKSRRDHAFEITNKKREMAHKKLR